MAHTFQVYPPSNTGASLGTLSSATHGVGWTHDLRVPGNLALRVPIRSAADVALLRPLRVVRVHDGTKDLDAYVIRDEPAELVVDERSGRPMLQVICDQVVSRLGWARGGATLWPYDGLDGLQQSPRWMGPMGWDFLERTGIPEPTTGGPLTRENWQDRRAERFVFNERAVYRRILTGDPAWADHPSRQWFTCAAWTEARVWLDGAELTTLYSGVGDRIIHTFDVVYDGEDHVICIDAKGTPPAGAQNSLGWTWGAIEADANGEYNLWNVENRFFTTFNSTTYEGPTAPTAPFWQAWEDYADGDYPGVTCGYASRISIEEAQARGLLAGITVGAFTDELDDAGDPWGLEWTHAFQVGEKLGPYHQEVAGFGCEIEMTPAGVLKLWQQRGTDRRASITITAPKALSSTGEGPKATRYLYETEGGFGAIIDAAAEVEWDEAFEEFATLGNDLHPHTIAPALQLQLADDAAMRNALEVELPDDLVPLTDVFLGDLVRCQSEADGTVSDARITSFRAERLDDTARVRHVAVLEPWS